MSVLPNSTRLLATTVTGQTLTLRMRPRFSGSTSGRMASRTAHSAQGEGGWCERMVSREQRGSERVEAPPTSELTCVKLGLSQRPIVDESLLAAHGRVGHAAAGQMRRKRPGGAISSPHRKEETFNAPHQQPLLPASGSAAPVDKGEHADLLLPAPNRDAERFHSDA